MVAAAVLETVVLWRMGSTPIFGTIHYHNSVWYTANYLLKQRGNCGSPNVAEVMMLKETEKNLDSESRIDLGQFLLVV